jgi:hemolysin-activating ACP:hemolysin acyltransferase
VDRQPQASAGNGAGGLRLGQSFAQVVAVLMRDRNFRQMRLADLEWLVLPPLMAGQFRLAQMPALQRGTAGSTQPGVQGSTLASDKGKDGGDGGMLVPVAVALWARVSAVIDRQLSENLDKVVRLGAGDWASGEHVWLMAVAGDRRIVPKLLEQLAKDEFKGQRVKTRVRGPDNTVVVRTLGQSASA